jgi:energy-coupling factor transporter ATP-binding protein EcfA2
VRVRQGEGGGGCRGGVSFFRKRLYFSGKFDKMNSGPSFGIVSFRILDFRGVKDTSVDGIPADTKWIFLTGKNGGGKTSVLQALFVGLLGKEEGKTILEEGAFTINILVLALNGDEIRFFENGDKAHAHDVSVWSEFPFDDLFRSQKLIIAYGAIRTQIQNGINADIPDKYYRSKSLFGINSPLLNIEAELKNWIYRSTSTEVINKDQQLAARLEVRAQKFKELLLRLMPNLERIEVDVIKEKVLYYEKDDEGSIITNAKTFEQLAAGNRSIIAMIGDMVIRLFQVQDNVSDPSDLEGIVLIDELDVHLHPTWQKALPGLLSEIFPKIQFIASTHSPIPLLGAPKESVVLKVHQSNEAGITVEKLNIDVSQLLPNSLLTSPIFDFEDIIPTANTSLEDLHTEDNYEEAMANEAIVERLKKIAQTL